MKDCPDKQNLVAFAGKLLPIEQQQQIEKHVVKCPSCLKLLQEIEVVAAKLQEGLDDNTTPATPLGSEADVELERDPELMLPAPGAKAPPLWFSIWRWLTEPSISFSGFQLPRVAFVAVGLFGLFLIPFFMRPNIVNPIADQKGSIGLAASGRVVNEWGGRLGAEPAGWVSQLLKGESIQLASAAQSLTASLGGVATMLGTRGAEVTVPLLESPTDSLVKGVPFEFQWQGVAGVTDYEVKIVQADGDPVIHRVSGATRVSSADLPFTFVPGGTYRWYVEGIVGPEAMELPISAQSAFGILDSNSAAEVASIEGVHGDSLLILTSTYLRFGLYDDAARTLSDLETLNPGHVGVARMREILDQAP